MSESPSEDRDADRRHSLWRESHGNLLLALMACICLVGFSVLAYRQSRFVPPRFPDAGAIQPNRPDASIEGAAPGADEIAVVVRGAVGDNGEMFLAVYASADGFNQPGQAILRRKQVVSDHAAVFALPIAELPDRFAIAVFHDQDGNAELSRNAVGIPTERYGYTNDARGALGPPAFDEAVIDRPESETIELVIR